MKESPINIERLILIRDNLINNVTQEQFNMGVYTNLFSENCECGSQGCIIGNSVKLDLKNFQKLKKETFENEGVGKRSIIDLYYSWSLKFLEISENGTQKLWDYLFSEEWELIDNSIQGAINRINYVIEHKTHNEEEYNVLEEFL